MADNFYIKNLSVTDSTNSYVRDNAALLKKEEPMQKIVVPSDYFLKEIVRRYDINKENIVVFPSGGVNKNVFYKKDKQEAMKRAGLNKSFRYIGYVSRIEEKKGWDTYIDMINLWKKRLPSDIKFLIVGEGTQEVALNTKIYEYGLNDYIIIKKMQKQKELSDIYNCLDIFCFPTYRQSESLGLVGIEAMACGCVVLSTDEYGPSTYINNNENGFVFKSRDAEDMLKKIEYILELSPQRKSEVSKNAENKSNEFDSEKIIKKLCDMLESI